MRRNDCGPTTRVLLLLSALCTSSGCLAARAEPRCTDLRPRPGHLPPEISQIMRPDSTELSKRASDWSESSEQLLDSVKTN